MSDAYFFLLPLLMNKFFTLLRRVGRGNQIGFLGALLALLPLLGWAQGNETFTSANTTSSYTSNTYTGDNGVSWSFANALTATLNGRAITLRNSPAGSLTSTAVSGGLSALSFNYKQANSIAVNATVAVNGIAVGTITSTASATTGTFSITGKTFTGSVSISITVNSGGGQTTVDDIVWSGYVEAASSPILSTTAPSSISQTGATLAGTISSFGSPTGSSPAYGFVYSPAATNSAPQLGGSGVSSVVVGSAAFTGDFGSAVTGLTASTAYSYQAYATNGTGTSYGGVQSFTTTASGGAPSIVVSALSPAATPSLGTVAVNTPGSVYTYTVSGTNLTTGITITPPVGIEVSKDGFSTVGNTNSTPLILSASGGSVASTTISVRLVASATAGTVSGTISNVSGSASQSLAVSGTVAAAPASCLSEGFEGTTFAPAGWLATGVTRSTATGDFKNGAAAAIFSGTTGTLTTPALTNPLSLTFYLGVTSNNSPKQFQVNVSTTSPTSGFTTLRTFSHNTTGGTVVADNAYNQYTIDLSAYSSFSTVYVQFAKVNSTTTSPFRFDDVAVSCGTAPAFSLSTGTISGTQFCVAKSYPTSIAVPYTVSGGSFGAGNVFTAVISKDNFVTKTSLGTLSAVSSGTIAGALPNTLTTGTYRVRVEASSPATISADNGTDLELTSYLTNEIGNYFGTGDNGQVTLTWTNPTSCFSQVLIVARAGVFPSAAPSNATTYTANPAFGLGSELPAGSGQYVVYQGNGTSATITGLTNGTAYSFKAFVTNGDGYSNGSARTVTPVVPATLSEVAVPQLISGHAVGALHTERLPYAYRITIGGLKPNATYKYYNSAVSANAGSADAAGYQGTGNPIYPDGAGSFRRVVGNNLSTAGSTLTTDASGSYTGWFMLEPNGNDRFEPGDLVKMRVILNDGAGGSSEIYYVTTASTVSVRQLGTTSGSAVQATALYGNSFGTPSNFVLTYDNPAGTGRPLAATFLESDGSANTTANSNASFYGTNVEGKAGAYGLLIPNDNANGVQRIEQRSLSDGSLVGCAATDADGTWAGTGAITKSPAGGATALVLTSGDTPFYPATITGFSPASALEGATITITGTNFTTGPQPLVSFNGGPAVSAATVNATGTSLTVVVPVGAANGPIAITAGCGNAAVSSDSFTNSSRPLPVALTGFTAARQATSVQLRWTTASEHSSAYFEVQRSRDSRTFSPVAKVERISNSSQATSYAFLDREAPAGRLYYRLRQVDTDSSATFSLVRGVGAGVRALSIFPNPAQTIISFQNPTGAPLSYRILNQLGQVLREGLAPAGIATVEVAGIPAGSYLLELQTDLGRVASRFSKE